MKTRLKEITLKNETIEDIKIGIVDTDKYIDYIRTSLNNAQYLLKTKLLALDDLSLYEALSKIFLIELDEEDLLQALKAKYNKHYTRIVTIKTNMLDNQSNNIVLTGAATKEILNTDKIISINVIRRITNSYEFIILDTKKTKLEERVTNYSKYENYQFENENLEFNENNELFTYFLALLKKDVRDRTNLKRILYLIDKYIKELIYQAKYITRLGEEDENLINISKLYKEAFESTFSKKDINTKGNHLHHH